MNKQLQLFDAIIIGGGMFGLYTAQILLSKGMTVAVLEKEKDIFGRASMINQARIHRGYHYPRSLETAQKTARYYDRFCDDFGFALFNPFRQYYAISKENSLVSASKYDRFCKKIKIPLVEIDKNKFFKGEKVEAVFEAAEACFDYQKIKHYFLKQFNGNKNICIFYESFPQSQEIYSSKYILKLNTGVTIGAKSLVINSTYKNVNDINSMFGYPGYELKYERCELVLCRLTDDFSKLGLTVMDGPFFSMMPFGNGDYSSFSSVKFTPLETSYVGSQNLEKNPQKSNWTKTLDLAKSYLHDGISFEYQSSIYETKPILLSSEKDDARPTLITIHSTFPFFMSVLAGKISTIYDLEEKLNFL